MADSTHYNYHYSCCGATQRLCVRHHTNNTLSTINLFAKLCKALRDQADFKQEEERMNGKKMGNEAPVDNYQRISPYGFACLKRKVNSSRENNLA